MTVYSLLFPNPIDDRYLHLQEILNYNHERPSLLTLNREFQSIYPSAPQFHTSRPCFLARWQLHKCGTISHLMYSYKSLCNVFIYTDPFYRHHLTYSSYQPVNSYYYRCCCCCCYHHNFVVWKIKA